jgi:hypothetical protein
MVSIVRYAQMTDSLGAITVIDIIAMSAVMMTAMNIMAYTIMVIDLTHCLSKPIEILRVKVLTHIEACHI